MSWIYLRFAPLYVVRDSEDVRLEELVRRFLMPHPPEGSCDDNWLIKMVELAKARDQGAFAVLFEHYNAEICMLLARLIDDKEEVYSLANDTFFKAWLNLPKLQDESRFRAWLYVIATNNARDYLRRQRIIRWLPWSKLKETDTSFTFSMEGHEENIVRTDLVKLALKQVPWKYRTCLLMQAHGFSQIEIAEAMGISQASVSTYVSKGRTLFLQAYRQLEGEPRITTTRRESSQ
jgi:RNA polymerase sigma-70 factor (ECF subfamily)